MSADKPPRNSYSWNSLSGLGISLIATPSGVAHRLAELSSTLELIHRDQRAPAAHRRCALRYQPFLAALSEGAPFVEELWSIALDPDGSILKLDEVLEPLIGTYRLPVKAGYTVAGWLDLLLCARIDADAPRREPLFSTFLATAPSPTWEIQMLYPSPQSLGDSSTIRAVELVRLLGPSDETKTECRRRLARELHRPLTRFLRTARKSNKGRPRLMALPQYMGVRVLECQRWSRAIDRSNEPKGSPASTIHDTCLDSFNVNLSPRRRIESIRADLIYGLLEPLDFVAAAGARKDVPTLARWWALTAFQKLSPPEIAKIEGPDLDGDGLLTFEETILRKLYAHGIAPMKQ